MDSVWGCHSGKAIAYILNNELTWCFYSGSQKAIVYEEWSFWLHILLKIQYKIPIYISKHFVIYSQGISRKYKCFNKSKTIPAQTKHA